MQDNKLTKALVLNAKLGNNSAFEQLYQMTVEPIYALNLRLTGNSSSAENLTKRTYINAWQKISQKDEFSSILSWLKKIAVETVLSEKVEDKKTSEKKSEDSLFSKNPFEKFIQELSSKNKIVYILHDIENYSFDEISKLSGISNEEIKVLLIQTRDNLIKLTEE